MSRLHGRHRRAPWYVCRHRRNLAGLVHFLLAQMLSSPAPRALLRERRATLGGYFARNAILSATSLSLYMRPLPCLLIVHIQPNENFAELSSVYLNVVLRVSAFFSRFIKETSETSNILRKNDIFLNTGN